MDIQPVWISRAFWTLFSLGAAGSLFLMFWAPSAKSGPEGPVGAWLVYVAPPILLLPPLAVVLFGRSNNANLIGLALVAWPIVPVVIGPIFSAYDNFCTERRVAGDFTFLRPTQRRLAHAFRAHDARLAAELIPQAGDLNAPHFGVSLFEFGITNLDKSAASVQIVKAMLDHGANPNLSSSSRTHVLVFATSNGPDVTKLLLDAGADPNSLEADTGRRVWWNVLYQNSPEGLETLRLMLDRGADVTRRDSNNGPVGWATHLKNWPAVWLLMERGAAWKNETSFGEPILRELEYDFSSRRGSRLEIPEEMEKIRAKLQAEQEQ